MHGGEAHAAGVVHGYRERGRLEGGGSHAAHVLDEVLARDGAGARGLDDEAGRGGLKGRVVGAGERDSEGLAEARPDGDVDGALAGYIAFEHGARGVDGGLAADDAHPAAGGHGARHVAFDRGARGGVGGGERGEELVEFIVVAQLQQVPLSDGFEEADAGDGSATAPIVGMEPANVAARGPASEYLAD